MNTPTSRIRVGISSCLLGEQVRYDGSAKLSTVCTNELGRLFELVPTCPEAGAGMGVPRPPIRLVGDPHAPRVVLVHDSSVDLTAQLQGYSRARLAQLQNLCGYILTSRSPSCGLDSVKVYDEQGVLRQEQGRGIFAAELTSTCPQLPVEEDERLQDPLLRESFIARVQAWHGWRQLCAQRLTLASISGFHSHYRARLLTQAAEQCELLEQMLASAGNADPAELGERYFSALLQALHA